VTYNYPSIGLVGTDTITGSFTYDASNYTETNVFISVTGPLAPGIYTQSSYNFGGNVNIIYAVNTPDVNGTLELIFPYGSLETSATSIPLCNPVVCGPLSPGFYILVLGDASTVTGEAILSTQPCNIECYNVFVPLSKPASSFTIELPGNVASEVNTAATSDDPLINPFAYVNQNFFGGSGSSSATASFDGTNTEITYTGTYPILPSYTYSYGSSPHFGFEGVDPPILSQYWTYSDGSLGPQPALGITCTPGGSNFLVFFAEVTVGGQTVGEWNECQGSGITLTNSTNRAEVLSNVGYYLSTTDIPLDSLNFASFPPPNQAGTQFTGLPSIDGATLSPGSSINVSVAAPPSGTACNGMFDGTFTGNITVSAGQTCTFISGGKITGNVNVTGGSFTLNAAAVGGNLTETAGGLALGSNATVGGNVQVSGLSQLSLSSGAIGGNLQIQQLAAGLPQGMVCGTQVKGGLQIQNNASPLAFGARNPQTCTGNAVAGDLQANNNSAALAIDSNRVGGNLQAGNNTGGIDVSANSVGKNLQCQNNNPTPTYVTVNTVGGNAQGQCAAFP
jgi:hypothetical protein